MGKRLQKELSRHLFNGNEELPIVMVCAYCKKRIDKVTRMPYGELITKPNDKVNYSHGVCKVCLTGVQKEIDEIRKRQRKDSNLNR